jgi:hypothetical protein
MGSGFDDWVYWHSLQLQSIMTAHNQWLSTTRSNIYWTTSVLSSAVTNDEWRIPAHTLNSLNDFCLKNLYEESLTAVWVPEWSLLLVEFKSKLCYDRRSVGQSVFVYSTHVGLKTRSLFLSDSCSLFYMGRSLWREDGSVVCQSHSQQ